MEGIRPDRPGKGQFSFDSGALQEIMHGQNIGRLFKTAAESNESEWMEERKNSFAGKTTMK